MSLSLKEKLFLLMPVCPHVSAVVAFGYAEAQTKHMSL